MKGRDSYFLAKQMSLATQPSDWQLWATATSTAPPLLPARVEGGESKENASLLYHFSSRCHMYMTAAQLTQNPALRHPWNALFGIFTRVATHSLGSYIRVLLHGRAALPTTHRILAEPGITLLHPNPLQLVGPLFWSSNLRGSQCLSLHLSSFLLTKIKCIS